MECYTIFFQTKTCNPYRSYPQNMDRYARSITITGGIQEAEKKINDLKENQNVKTETIRAFNAVGKCIYEAL